MRTGMAQRIREAAKRLHTFSVRQLADEIGVRSYLENTKMRSTLRDFRRRGEIANIARGHWRYCGREHAGKGKGVRERVYRAMYTKRIFAARDLVMLTDVDGNYVRILIRGLMKAGHVRKLGGRPINGTRRQEAVFGLVDSDQFYLEFVK